MSAAHAYFAPSQPSEGTADREIRKGSSPFCYVAYGIFNVSCLKGHRQILL